MAMYAVHLYPSVRVKVACVEAETALDAAVKAEESLNLGELLLNQNPGRGVEVVVWDEGPTKVAQVDRLLPGGDVDYAGAAEVDLLAGKLLVDGKTEEEAAAARARKAAAFMKELLDTYGPLTRVADAYGVPTLADLTHLQSAIIDGSPHDAHDWSGSRVLELVQSMPSSDAWIPHLTGAQHRERVGARHTGG